MNINEPKRKSFAFYWSFKDAIRSVPTDKDKLEIYEAITDFAFLGKEPELSPFGKALWSLMKPNLLSAMERYDRCVNNGLKGAKHGKKGGRPRKEKPQEKPQEKPHNDNDNDNDNDNVQGESIDSQKGNVHEHSHLRELVEWMESENLEYLSDKTNFQWYLTPDNLNGILRTHSMDEVKQVLSDIENRLDLRGKFKSFRKMLITFLDSPLNEMNR